ncbi:16981_t:CDS:2, partial [Acaulospora colombiana]
MLFNVVEGVLGNIANDQVGVLPDFTTLVGLEVANEQLDEGTLSGTVGTENGHTGRERDLEGDIVELLLGLGRVLEANLAHLEERLLLGLDTIEEWWVGEGKLVVLGGFEGVVRLGLWDGLDERLEVTTVPLDLEAVEVEDIGDVSEASEIALQPGNVDNIQVVSRLIEQENVSLEEHCTGKCKLHLPTTREGADRVSLPLVIETNRGEGVNDFLPFSENALVREDKVEDGGRLFASVNVVLDVESADLFGGWEALDLAIGDGTHERGFTGTVTAAETIAVATLETEDN